MLKLMLPVTIALGLINFSLLINSLFVNHSSIRELASAIDVKLLPITDETVQKVVDEWSIREFTIPADAYDWNDEDVQTVTVAPSCGGRPATC